MRKQLIFLILVLCGLQQAFGQCGSTRGSDLDGGFASSTSSDPCGHPQLLGSTLYTSQLKSKDQPVGQFGISQESSQAPLAPSTFELLISIETSQTITAHFQTLVSRPGHQTAPAMRRYDLDDRISITLLSTSSYRGVNRSCSNGGAYEV